MCRILLRNREQTVLVADHDIARIHHHAADRHRHVDLTWTVLIRAAMRHPARVDRKIPFADFGDIANCTIDHQTDNAT